MTLTTLRLPRRVQALLSWLPAVALYGLITWLSNQPQLPAPGEVVADWIWFKSAHFLVYGTLGFFVWFALRMQEISLSKLQLATWYLLMILATLDELHQSFVPGRGSRPSDVLIDLLAVWTVLQVLARYNKFTARE